MKNKTAILTNLRPGDNVVQRLLVSVGFRLLGQAFQTASRIYPELRRELSEWPVGFVFALQVLPNGPVISFIKQKNKVRFLGLRYRDAELTVTIKNLTAARDLILARTGIFQAYAQHRVGVRGDLNHSARLSRCINLVETLIFPRFMCRKIMRALPPRSLRRVFIRLAVFIPGFVFGW